MEDEVQTGNLNEAEMKARVWHLEQSNLIVKRDWLDRLACKEARKQLEIPGFSCIRFHPSERASLCGSFQIPQDSICLVEAAVTV